MFGTTTTSATAWIVCATSHLGYIAEGVTRTVEYEDLETVELGETCCQISQKNIAHNMTPKI